MYVNRNKMRFLSESILLEETGLPRMNTIIVATVSIIIILFIVWSNQLVMEESISVSGQVALIEKQDVEFVGFVRTKDVSFINIGGSVNISIPGITGRQKFSGEVVKINTEPRFDSNNTAYYEIDILLLENEEINADLINMLYKGMDSRIEVITGSKTMLQYLLGTLYDTGKDVFDIK